MSCDKNVFSMHVFLGLSRFATRDAGDLCRDNAPSTANSSFIFEYTKGMSPSRVSRSLKIGAGDLRYEALVQWESLPEGWSFVEVAGVATDSQDRVYVF